MVYRLPHQRYACADKLCNGKSPLVFQRICAECVCRNDVCACGKIFFVNPRDNGAVRDVQIFGNVVVRNSRGLNHRAHTAVKKQRQPRRLAL